MPSTFSGAADRDAVVLSGTASNVARTRVAGRVESWMGDFGWIVAAGCVDYGRIFASERDFEGLWELREGDEVSFEMAHSTGHGVCAREIRLEVAAPAEQAESARALASGICWWGDRMLSSEPGVRFTGSVKSWKGNYGWIVADTHIDSSAAMRHKGWIFAHTQDVEGGTELHFGDRVSFTTYEDSKGLGASEVRLERAGGSAFKKTTGSSQWWQDMNEICCPISLKPLADLEREPFGLMSEDSSDASDFDEGVWGTAAVASFLSLQPVRWFDGLLLACLIVSGCRLMDPVSNRPLTRGECVSLDQYLSAHGLPDVHVAKVFDLLNVTESCEGGDIEHMHLSAFVQGAACTLKSFGGTPPMAPLHHSFRRSPVAAEAAVLIPAPASAIPAIDTAPAVAPLVAAPTDAFLVVDQLACELQAPPQRPRRRWGNR